MRAGERRLQAGGFAQDFKQRQIALRADVINRRIAARSNQSERHIAGCHQFIERLARHAQRSQLFKNRRKRARRIGDQHHLAALAPVCLKRCTGLRKVLLAVVDDAPHIAKDNVIVSGDL